MSDTLTPEAAEEFRAQCAAFIAENAFKRDRSNDPRSAKSMASTQKFQKALAEAGLAGLTYDTEFGGAGLTRAHDKIWREEFGKSGMMGIDLVISHGMCLPVLNEFGSEEQKKTYMPKNISGEEVWCQMFSEPGAGSDVASLQTKAVLDGEEWVINGQKVWTTLAHLCDYGILIARTDPDQVKHAGLSMFIVDMNDPSVEIRAIHQIDGGQHFNEVFFTDTKIPKDNLVGPIHDGWRLATAMLMYERVAIGSGGSAGVSHQSTDNLIAAAQNNGKISDPNIRQELMKMYCEETAKSLVAIQTRAQLKAGKTPGPGGSLGKLHGAVIAEMYRNLSLEIVGASAVAWDPSTEGGDKWSMGALNTFQSSIAGGTNEIQRNIIGDRVLGLPREPSVDKGVPFSQLKVGTQESA